MEIFGEYDDPKPMQFAYCQQIPPEQYNKQGAVETEKALQELMDFLEKNPDTYRRNLVRKKQEDAENAGILSYVKCKVMATLHGPEYMRDEVTNEETLHKIGQLQHEMTKAYDYAQEANNSRKRFSRRIAARKAKVNTTVVTTDKENTLPANFKKPTWGKSKSKVPPPTPSYPPPSLLSPTTSDDDVFSIILPVTPGKRPPLHPSKGSVDSDAPPQPPPQPPPLPPTSGNSRVLRERTHINKQISFNSPSFKSTPKQLSRNPSHLKKSGSSSSLCSIVSVHDELLSFDKNTLKSISKLSQPFKTPHSKKRLLSASIARASLTDICGISSVDVFNQQMLKKFRNARSPLAATQSPSSGFNSQESTLNSPSGFTP